MTQQTLEKVESENSVELSSDTQFIDPFFDDQFFEFFLNSRGGKSFPNTKRVRQLSVAYACVDILSKTVSTCPIRVYYEENNLKRNVDSTNWLARLIRKPNKLMSKVKFFKLVETSLLWSGAFYALKVYHNDRDKRVKELRPLHSNRMQVVELDDYEYGFIYKDKHGQPSALKREDVFHIFEQTDDGINPLSPIAAAAQTFQQALNLQDHGNAIFENDARPSGLIKVPAAFKDKEQSKKMREEWEEIHRGPKNSHRIAILQNGAEYQQLGMNSRDAQFIEILRLSDESLMRIFDVPPYRVQDFSRATFANVEEGGINFAKNSIDPRTDKIEEEFYDQIILPTLEDDLRIEFILDHLYMGNALSRFQAFRQAIEAGIYNRDEVRAKIGENPIPGGSGSTFVVPVNLQPSEDLGKSDGEQQEQQEFAEKRESCVKILAEKIRHVERKEQEAVRRALKKDNFLKWADSFYSDKHTEFMFEQLTETVRAFEPILGQDLLPSLASCINIHVEEQTKFCLVEPEKILENNYSEDLAQKIVGDGNGKISS